MNIEIHDTGVVYLIGYTSSMDEDADGYIHKRRVSLGTDVCNYHPGEAVWYIKKNHNKISYIINFMV